MAWRNIYYDGKNREMHLWTWNKNGERIETVTEFEPYLYIESENGTDAKSIFNTSLKKLSFKNQKARQSYVDATPIKRLFYNLDIQQQFLLHTFKNEIDKPDFGSHPLRIFYIAYANEKYDSYKKYSIMMLDF